ncbi:MAG: Resolvase domain protein [Gemmataceae bacterium]|nr:Resolvase domain protein [Gemmataceae bacterium]
MDQKPTGTRGVAYLRVSNARQNQETQRDSIRRWLDQRGLGVWRWYEDAGSRDLAYKRDAFLELLKDVERGLIDWIVVDAKDRFGTANAWEFGKFVCHLREHDCQLWSVLQGHLTADDAVTDILSTVDSVRSRDEQVARSQRTLRGKVPAARKGEWQGGYPPYSFDLACFGPDDREKWRVFYEGHFRRLKVYPDGRPPERFDGREKMPARDKGDVLRIVPSLDPVRVETVRRIFHWFATEAVSKRGIASRLNALGVPPVFSTRGWYSPLVAKILDNPAYVTGTPVWNKQGSGRFLEFRDGEYREVARVKGRVPQGRSRGESDLVFADRHDPGIVDRETYDLVQAKLKSGPEYCRAPRNPDLWLAGLLRCGRCGRPMTGWHRRRRTSPNCYVCSTYNTCGPGNATGCRTHFVPAAVVESLVEKYLDSAGLTLDELLVAEDESALLDACQLKLDRVQEEYARAICRAYTEVKEAKANPPLGEPWAYPSLIVAYREIFGGRQEDVRRELAAKEADLERLVDQFALLQNREAAATARRRLDALGGEIERLREQLQPPGEKLCGLRAELEAARGRVADTLAAVAGGSSRRKAQALRQVVSRIECRFRHYEVGSRRKSSLEAVVVHPVTGEATPLVVQETRPVPR